MYSLRVLNNKETNDLLDMKQALFDVELAYRLFTKGEAGVFPVIVHQFEKGKREMDLKSGHLTGAGVFGMKMLGFCSDKLAHGIKPLSGLILVMDVKKQQPIGILDGTPITFFRTGAAGGVAAKTFARKDSKQALIIGAGNQGRAQLYGLTTAIPKLKKIHISDIVDEYSLDFVKEQSRRYPDIRIKHVAFQDLAAVLRNMDIIVTCTRARNWFLKKEWISPGTHINAIGADMPGKQEIDPTLMKTVKLFGDSRMQVIEKGESQHAAKAGQIKKSDIVEIGEVLENIKSGRSSDEDITLFDATGMAIQDLIVAKNLLERAKREGIGIEVEF